MFHHHVVGPSSTRIELDDGLSLDSGLGMASQPSSPMTPKHLASFEYMTRSLSPNNPFSDDAAAGLEDLFPDEASLPSPVPEPSTPLRELTHPSTPKTQPQPHTSPLLLTADRRATRTLSLKLGPVPKKRRQSTTQLAEQLHHAIDKNDTGAILKLIKEGRIDPNIQRRGASLSPLHEALAARSVDSANFLALSGADLEATNRTKETAIITATKNSFPLASVTLLCELGAKLDAVDIFGRSALHYAASSHGPSASSSSSTSPSSSSSYEDEKAEIVKVLCSHGANPNLPDETGHMPLHQAVHNVHLAAARQLLDCGADINAATKSGRTPLYLAIAKRSTDIVSLLCERGAVINRCVGDSTPLLAAITAGCTDIARVLIQAGAADPNLSGGKGNFPLLMAAALGNEELVEMLLAHGADVHVASNSTGMTPLHVACQGGHEGIVGMLIRAGTPVDGVNNDGLTPLALAVEGVHDEIVQMLLMHGRADANHTYDGQSLLWRALERLIAATNLASKTTSSPGTSTAVAHAKYVTVTAIERIIQLLITSGADVTAPQGDLGITPLHQACRLGLDSIVEMMLSTPKDVRTSASFHGEKYGHSGVVETHLWSGHTPLFFAVEGGHLTTTKLLIEKYHANINARTAVDATLLWAAIGHPHILRYLLTLKPLQGQGVNRNGSVRKRLRLMSFGRGSEDGTLGGECFDVNHRDHGGATVLHAAAAAGHMEDVRILLRKGAKQFAAHEVYDDLAGRKGGTYRQGTPAGIARQKGHDRIVELIEGWR
ncbi:ankyrin repeat-containing domain protein [Sordaria brevicollis]|uniref:Ankyrin repeat-containing domain protein n=1 Tax=Sordaria brevicollis TaxID=83679 RepID=A0AAE0PH31_SORBR|nr:ankyrin repeat-containing domain protein [Sordaria brevicollis]